MIKFRVSAIRVDTMGITLEFNEEEGSLSKKEPTFNRCSATNGVNFSLLFRKEDTLFETVSELGIGDEFILSPRPVVVKEE
jgi:hypothetical protein